MLGTVSPVRANPRLRNAILAWFDERGRRLPFRRTTEPYLVLVSEVMAQQTQISRVGPAWMTFTAVFPTVERLAAASPADVIRAWRGLGYNRRALNLWRAAGVIVNEHGGRVPSAVADLERLPGIGPYTARAVAAIAFGVPVGAVDTNVRRVLGRAMAGDADLLTPREMQSLADRSVPRDRPADWTHALMDVGAIFCRSTNPGCEACPARPWCLSVKASGRGARPRRPARSAASTSVFSDSSRWLRGRIVDRLRNTPAPGSVRFVEPIGAHGDRAILVALGNLRRDGLVECDVADPRRARLPQARPAVAAVNG